MNKNNYLNLYYDEEADILYFSKDTPSDKDISDEASDEVVLRRDPKSKKEGASLQIPLKVDFQSASFV